MSSQLVSWQQGSNSRGTDDIISLCASTLLICVWGAVHVDIPSRRTFWDTYVKRIGWIVVGVVVPEMLVVTALGQLIVARELVKVARTYLPASNPIPKSRWRICVDASIHWLLKAGAHCISRSRCLLVSWTGLHPAGAASSGSACEREADPEQLSALAQGRKHPWTLGHGFYAAMGGFVFETAHGTPFLPLKDTRVVISRTGLQYLMQHAPELIPDIGADDIADRSKVSAISKALLCCQVVYFCSSCAARLSQQLPLTLLEITTFAHSLCALLAYALWWYKPQDVGEPTLITGDKARELCALMFMSNNLESYYPLGLGRSHLWPAEIEYLTISPCSEIRASRDLAETSVGPEPLLFLPRQPFFGFAPKTRAEIYELLAFYMPPEIKSPLSSKYAPWYLRHSLPWYMPPTRHVDWSLDPRDITRFELCRRALLSHSSIFSPSTPWQKRWPLLNLTQQLGQPLERFPRLQLRFAPAIIALFYGLPHFLAWWQEFPSANEKFEWHMACIAVIGTPVLSFLFLWLTVPEDASNWQGLVLFASPLFAYLCPVLYVISSGFLVYESCRQLLALPAGAFLEAHMTFYWPHFS